MLDSRVPDSWSPMSARARTRLLAVIVFLIALAILVAHAASYRVFVADDALISLRYAERLLDGHGLTWTAGERVEGYSNLLWVLATAGLGALGMDLFVAMRALGLVAGAVALFALTAARPRTEPVWTWAVVPVAYALSGTTGAWTLAGLEAPLVGALLALAFLGLWRAADDDTHRARHEAVAAIALGLLAWTRPDGILFTACLAAALVFGPDPSLPTWSTRWLRALRIAVAPAAAVAAQLVFRWAYYGEWVPNTARVKLGWSVQRVVDGLGHVGGGAWSLAPLVLFGVAGIVLGLRSPRDRTRAFGLACVGLVWTLYVAAVGGDVFPGYRHLVPLTVVLALGLGLGLAHVSSPRARRAAVVVVVATLAIHQIPHPGFRDVESETWVWYGRELADGLHRAFGDADPLLAVTAAGCLPYWSQMRSLDMLGLCDATIARNRPDDFGQGPLAHELGDPEVVFERRPDLIVFGAPGPDRGRAFAGRYGSAFVNDPRFASRYRAVRVEVDGPAELGGAPFRSTIWIATDSPRIGLRNVGDTLVVPAWFLTRDARAAVRLDSDGPPALVVAPAAPGEVLLGRPRQTIVSANVLPDVARKHARAILGRTTEGDVYVRVEADVPTRVDGVVLRFGD